MAKREDFPRWAAEQIHTLFSSRAPAIVRARLREQITAALEQDKQDEARKADWREKVSRHAARIHAEPRLTDEAAGPPGNGYVWLWWWPLDNRTPDYVDRAWWPEDVATLMRFGNSPPGTVPRVVGMLRPKEQVLPAMYLRVAIFHDRLVAGKGRDLLLSDFSNELPPWIHAALSLAPRSDKDTVWGKELFGLNHETIADALAAVKEDVLALAPESDEAEEIPRSKKVRKAARQSPTIKVVLPTAPPLVSTVTAPAPAGKRWVWDMYPLAKDSWGAWEVEPDMPRPDHRVYMYRVTNGDGTPWPVEAFAALSRRDAPSERILHREAYAPTDDDFDLLRSHFPNGDPHRPDWYKVKAELQAAKHDGDKLDRAEAPVLLRLLKATRDPPRTEAAAPESSPPQGGANAPKVELVPVATAYPDGVPPDVAKKWPHLPFDWIQTTAASLLHYPAALQAEKCFHEMARSEGRDPLADSLCKTARQRVYEL